MTAEQLPQKESLEHFAQKEAVTRGHISLLEAPYSEHSSYSELKRLVQFLTIGSKKDIIPTVNVKYKKNMAIMFKDWIEERKSKSRGPESQ